MSPDRQGFGYNPDTLPAFPNRCTLLEVQLPEDGIYRYPTFKLVAVP